MKIFVVYESTDSANSHFAEEVGQDLESLGDVIVGSTDAIRPDMAAEADLVVVGGSNHAGDATEPRIRDWLEKLACETGAKEPVVVTGSAAKGIAKRLAANSVTATNSVSATDQQMSVSPCLQM